METFRRRWRHFTGKSSTGKQSVERGVYWARIQAEKRRAWVESDCVGAGHGLSVSAMCRCLRIGRKVAALGMSGFDDERFNGQGLNWQSVVCMAKAQVSRNLHCKGASKFRGGCMAAFVDQLRS